MKEKHKKRKENALTVEERVNITRADNKRTPSHRIFAARSSTKIHRENTKKSQLLGEYQ